MSDAEHDVAALRSAEVTGSTPGVVLVAPWGVVASANGTFVVDEEAGRLTIEAFEAQGTELPIDYEHQTLGGRFASPTGQAPAAGWIRRLWLRRPEEGDDAAPGLYAEVSWTEPAKAQLAAKQYRYLSPVAIVRRSDRKMVGLHSAALTNKPAIVGMEAIVNQQEDEKAEKRKSEEESAARVSVGGEGLSRLREQLGLGAEVGTDEVVVAASERIAALHEAVRGQEAEALVVAAMKAGKLTENQRAWGLSLAMRDPAAFATWESSAPVVVVVGRSEEPATGDRGGREATAPAARARAEYHAHPELALLTSEEAYVALAVRDGATSTKC